MGLGFFLGRFGGYLVSVLCVFLGFFFLGVVGFFTCVFLLYFFFFFGVFGGRRFSVGFFLIFVFFGLVVGFWWGVVWGGILFFFLGFCGGVFSVFFFFFCLFGRGRVGCSSPRRIFPSAETFRYRETIYSLFPLTSYSFLLLPPPPSNLLA